MKVLSLILCFIPEGIKEDIESQKSNGKKRQERNFAKIREKKFYRVFGHELEAEIALKRISSFQWE